jgi:hypothetical protein
MYNIQNDSKNGSNMVIDSWIHIANNTHATSPTESEPTLIG